MNDFIDAYALMGEKHRDVLIFMLFGLLVLAAFMPRLRRRSRTKGGPLDAAIYRWNNSDALSVRNLLAGGIHCFGRTDSGKTSSMKAVAKAVLRYGNSSVLVLCAKSDDADNWLAYAEETGRSADVVRIAPDQPHRFNMIEYEATREGAGAGSAANVVRFISELRSVLFREAEAGGGDSQYWKKQDERAIGHAVTVLQIAGLAITPQSIHDLIMTAPQSTDELTAEMWESGACNNALKTAFYAGKSPIQDHDFKLATDYLTTEWPGMSDRTRASILVGVIGTLTAMNTGLCRELFANYTNITPAQAIEGKKIVIVDLPPDEYGDLGIVANVGWKYHWQKEILRRQISDGSPISCIWGDESSLWITPFDAKFLSRCRSSRGCMVYISQSLDSYYEVLPGDKAKAIVEAMLANFSHKLFFALGDHATATWAADLCGKQLQQFGGGGIQRSSHEMFGLGGGQSQYSSSFNEHFENVVQPGELMNGLRTGSPVNRYIVDALLIRSGVAFSNGLPILSVSFDQRS